jgi:hypothetical protein
MNAHSKLMHKKPTHTNPSKTYHMYVYNIAQLHIYTCVSPSGVAKHKHISISKPRIVKRHNSVTPIYMCHALLSSVTQAYKHI